MVYLKVLFNSLLIHKLKLEKRRKAVRAKCRAIKNFINQLIMYSDSTHFFH